MDAIDPTLDYPEPDDYEGGPPPGRGPVPGPPAAPQAARPAQPNGAALGAVIDYLSRIATALERIAGIQQLTNPAPPPAHGPAQPPPTYQQPPAPRAAGAVPWTLPAQQADPAAMAILQQWVCPDHGTPPKMVPAGITRSGPRQGQPYTAFWVCSTPRCNHKPPQ